jgi:subfamily B ATP-binding cassette protein MsbA
MSFRQSAVRLWRFARPHQGALAMAFLHMVALGLATGAFAFLLGPALRFLLSGGVAGLRLPARFIPSLQSLDREALLWAFPALILALGVFKGLAYLGQFYWVGFFGQRVAQDVRRALFQKLLSLSPVRMGRHRLGDLLSRVSLDASAIELAATYAVGSYLRDGLQIAILMAVALTIDWKLSLAMLLILPVAAIPASMLTRKVLRRTRQAQNDLGILSAQLQEGLSGLTTIQAFGAQVAELRRFSARTDSQIRALTKAAWAKGAVPGVMEILGACAIAGMLGFAMGRPGLQPESVVSVLAAIVLIYQPAKDLGRVSQFALQAHVASERIFELLDEPEAVPDAKGARPAELSRSIRFDSVSFSYGDRPALQGVDLEIPLGKVVALVGPSGSGKSTLASLLLRFEKPSAGRILFDGESIEGFTAESVRRQFALVTQDSFLFHATVEENIRYGNPSASPEQLVAAAKAASAHEFIQELPQGYQTPVGERGHLLSGGQRQRICLARAILAEAQVLVLDEATSSLDSQSEREVQAALSKLLQGRTAIVIAHRLQTVVDADVIFVLDAGKVVEVGTHGELLSRGGLYGRMWALQHGLAAPGQVASR